MLEFRNGGVGAVRVGGGKSAWERCLAYGNVADEECASSDFLGRSVGVRVKIVGRLGRCRTFKWAEACVRRSPAGGGA